MRKCGFFFLRTYPTYAVRCIAEGIGERFTSSRFRSSHERNAEKQKDAIGSRAPDSRVGLWSGAVLDAGRSESGKHAIVLGIGEGEGAHKARMLVKIA